MSEQAIPLKIVLIGEAKVGKTCIILRFTKNIFGFGSASTLGISFVSKTVSINDKLIQMNIWDTAGQERFGSLTKLYSREAQVLILVFDITCSSSFERMIKLYEIYTADGFCENTTIAVIGNKQDLEKIEDIELLQKAESFASKNNLQFFKTSALLNTGIDEAFFEVCRYYIENHDYTSKNTISLENFRKRKQCCR